MASGGRVVVRPRFSFPFLLISNRHTFLLDSSLSHSKQRPATSSNRHKIGTTWLAFVSQPPSRLRAARCILKRMLPLDSGQEFNPASDEDFFTSLPPRPGVFLLEMAEPGAQPYLARTADIRRAAERLLREPEALSKNPLPRHRFEIRADLGALRTSQGLFPAPLPRPDAPPPARAAESESAK